MPKRSRVVATAPVRVADVGGWTDTWFGSPGRVCHLAVGPGVRVEASLEPAAESGRPPPRFGGSPPGRPVRISAPDLGEHYWCGPSADRGWARPEPGRQPLLEHAIGSVLEQVEVPVDQVVGVTITSRVPPGASLGTSAAVVVAVLGALDALCARSMRSPGPLAGEGVPAAPRIRPPAELAAAAHGVETDRVGREAGVQDHWAAAVGGAGLLSVSPYPSVRHEVVDLSGEVVEHLGARLVTVVFGPHDSSAVHGDVIEAVVGCGGEAHDRARSALRNLAALAGDAAGALAAGEIDRWGAVLTEATEAQRALHPALVGPAHQAAIELAERHGARGWKVNGAGGAGGSLTILSSEPRCNHGRRSSEHLVTALERTDPSWRVVDLRPAPGLRIEVIEGS